MPQQSYDLGPADSAGHDSHFQMNTRHIANIGDHETRVSSLETFRTTANLNLVKATAAPTSGTHTQGEFVWNSSPTEQGTTGAKFVTLGWLCIISGTPGTWVANNNFTGN